MFEQHTLCRTRHRCWDMRLPSRTLSFLLSDSGERCRCASVGLCSCRRGAVRPLCRRIIEPLMLRTNLTHRLSARSSNDERNPICWPHAARTPKSLSTCQHLIVDAEVWHSGKALRRVEEVAYSVHHQRWLLRTAGICRWLQRRVRRFHNADGPAAELSCTVKRCMSVCSFNLYFCISAVPRLAMSQSVVITGTETRPRTGYTFIIDPVLIYTFNFSCRHICGRYEKLDHWHRDASENWVHFQN